MYISTKAIDENPWLWTVTKVLKLIGKTKHSEDTLKDKIAAVHDILLTFVIYRQS